MHLLSPPSHLHEGRETVQSPQEPPGHEGPRELYPTRPFSQRPSRLPGQTARGTVCNFPAVVNGSARAHPCARPRVSVTERRGRPTEGRVFHDGAPQTKARSYERWSPSIQTAALLRRPVIHSPVHPCSPALRLPLSCRPAARVGFSKTTLVFFHCVTLWRTARTQAHSHWDGQGRSSSLHRQ